jgi:Large polyvalent protein-associated domain 7
MAGDDEPGGARSRDDSGSPPPAERRARKEPGASPRRAPRASPPNAIEAGRRRSKAGAAATRETPRAPAAEAPPSAKPATVPPADSDPWTVPQSVRDRFVQDGNRFYFPDGAPAFRDLGRKLTTPSENTQVVHSLIQIAQSRRWSEVTVTGTERFRREAWKQARLAGVAVRGYRASEEERAELIRALGRNLPGPAERIDSVSASAPVSDAPQVAVPAADTAAVSNMGAGPTERIAGRLMEHGKDAYRHDPDQPSSYFVRLQTPSGPREVWGKDLERAVSASLTRPKIGDEVVLQRTGRDAVTVLRSERDESGAPTERPLDTYRNRWVIETREFLEQRAKAAQVVRNSAIEPREAVRQHPELAGTYLSLRAAELASRALRDPADQRRFVAQVRRVLAQEIERGEPLQPVRLKDREIRRELEPAHAR